MKQALKMGKLASCNQPTSLQRQGRRSHVIGASHDPAAKVPAPYDPPARSVEDTVLNESLRTEEHDLRRPAHNPDIQEVHLEASQSDSQPDAVQQAHIAVS